MPQITIDVYGRIESELVTLLIEKGDESIGSVVTLSKVNTAEKIVLWALERHYRTRQDYDQQKRITFTFHYDIGSEGEQIPILDSIDDVQPIPRDAGRDGIESLPGWATWTAQEAADWIDANVTDLDSAKTALSSMAKMLVYLRKATLGE